MKIEGVLEKLKRLLDGWGIREDDWILSAQYVHKLQGRDVSVREGHLNIIVRESSIPWKIGEELETFAPRRSRYEDEFQSFIETTGFEFDIVPRADDYFDKELADAVEYKTLHGEKIHLHSSLYQAAHLDELFSYCNEEGWGKEKGARILPEVEEVADALEKNGEHEDALVWRKLFRKYQHLLDEDVGQKIDIESGIVSGIVASPGKVSGVARIVFDTIEKAAFEENDVLITTMASPRLGVILEKAGAFVTDDGGMLSHVAILAREMNKPCIVGTKVATKVFKDGDKIEVDADAGVVRRL